jgi:putative membrane protein
MNSYLWIKTSAVALLVGTLPARADPGNNGNDTFGHMMWGGGHGWWAGFGMILFWGVIIAVAVFVFRTLTSNRIGETRDAMDILKERYARGEIDEDEFRRRKQELQG